MAVSPSPRHSRHIPHSQRIFVGRRQSVFFGISFACLWLRFVTHNGACWPQAFHRPRRSHNNHRG